MLKSCPLESRPESLFWFQRERLDSRSANLVATSDWLSTEQRAPRGSHALPAPSEPSLVITPSFTRRSGQHRAAHLPPSACCHQLVLFLTSQSRFPGVVESQTGYQMKKFAPFSPHSTPSLALPESHQFLPPPVTLFPSFFPLKSQFYIFYSQNLIN